MCGVWCSECDVFEVCVVCGVVFDVCVVRFSVCDVLHVCVVCSVVCNEFEFVWCVVQCV